MASDDLLPVDWSSLRYRCTACGAEQPASPQLWRCACGGAWAIASPGRFRLAHLQEGGDVARYACFLRAPLPDPAFLRQMPPTDLEQHHLEGQTAVLKPEHELPTGSFKARGGAVLVEALRAAGAQRLIEDSSGNAGLAIGTYAHRAGLKCDLYVPASCPKGKRRLLQATGARLELVEGSREDVARAAQQAVESHSEAVYASHVWNPLFIEGVQTFVWEVWEQCARLLPDALVLPAGNGTLLLGSWQGARALLEAGAIERLPRLIGVQAEACAPLARAWERSGDEPLPVAPGETRADGIRIATPARGREMLQAVRETGGAFLSVQEDQIAEAGRILADWGYEVEPTGAVALAGWLRMVREGHWGDPAGALVPLTGKAK